MGACSFESLFSGRPRDRVLPGAGIKTKHVPGNLTANHAIARRAVLGGQQSVVLASKERKTMELVGGSLLIRRHTVALVSLTVVAVSSLAANMVLYKEVSTLFRTRYALRLDPLELAHYANEVTAPVRPNERRVVLFGDSRALMWSTPRQTDGIQFVNRGIGYQTTTQILERFEREIPQLRPTTVVLELGVNDLAAIPLFPSQRQQITATAKRNIRELVSRVRKLGASVVLVPIFPLGPVALARRPWWSDDVALAIGEVNRELETLASDQVVVPRVDDVLLDEHGKLKKPFVYDMLHLTREAYRALNEQKLIPILSSLHRD
jgi:hypothetical protein